MSNQHGMEWNEMDLFSLTDTIYLSRSLDYLSECSFQCINTHQHIHESIDVLMHTHKRCVWNVFVSLTNK